MRIWGAAGEVDGVRVDEQWGEEAPWVSTFKEAVGKGRGAMTQDLAQAIIDLERAKGRPMNPDDWEQRWKQLLQNWKSASDTPSRVLRGCMEKITSMDERNTVNNVASFTTPFGFVEVQLYFDRTLNRETNLHITTTSY